MDWKYTMTELDHVTFFGQEEPRRVYRISDNGQMESCTVDRDDVQKWINTGNAIEKPNDAGA